jgi:hypothetical protein
MYFVAHSPEDGKPCLFVTFCRRRIFKAPMNPLRAAGIAHIYFVKL